MTGPEHYQQAESYLAQVEKGKTPEGAPIQGESLQKHLAAAQAHATLAHAAATIDAAPPEVDTVKHWRGTSYDA